MLLNLVMNSIQAMPVGGQSRYPLALRTKLVGIAVKDHGTGIPAAAVDRIFDPFFTTDEHRLGLGLALALRIVGEHGGRIMVDREHTNGLRFPSSAGGAMTLP